ncbi:hypothetical protein VDGE_30542 [Verticillium dahliae]|uniref:Uncharacterized protein n=1 Tax=Verticillium dahliae TaxID=27337 RepID=A0A444RKQ9_VERDA|nr:hypothetical protein VDGE_30542 [Verticillium dahliae]
MTQAQSTQPSASHSATTVPRDQAAAEIRCANVCFSNNGGPCTCDLAGRLDYDLWSLIQHFEKARKTLDNYREIAQRGNLERSYVLQQQHDSLNARWSSSYGELQKEAQKRAHDLQKALKDLENMKAKLKEQAADSQTTDMALRELRATVELQNREIVRSRALHFQVENLEREMAECKSVNQAVEAVLVMKKQRITELESALEEMSVKTKQLAADKVEHESLKLQFVALEAEHAETLDIASGLFEGEVGSTPAELISQNRALGQQLRELRAENGSLVERLAGFGPERDGSSHKQRIDGGKEQVLDCIVVESTGDEGKGRKRRRAK